MTGLKPEGEEKYCTCCGRALALRTDNANPVVRYSAQTGNPIRQSMKKVCHNSLCTNYLK